ncbi:hypothetical protein [Marinithermus hydrothermalis]|uniref:Thiol:disulfide interchange protein DsbD N-terminal domain-containing protein n=1 Tax=Marinithermus hydrothermalis (strain DSM 14884 / JCM 11576 / T1) TaxID=869210 RepID=F2NMZ9_MARHT|nr:hypothetical protein [Marinithermus hydrothermalis]AEB12738.1 hypothetical protein Marky_2010 [Marinithermus hydrothermalis DSM 14884]
MNRTLNRFGAAACLLGIAVGAFGVAQSGPTAAEPFAPLTLDLRDIGPSHTKYLPDPPKGQVTVQFLARAINARIPGEFRFYLAAPEVRRLWTTLSLPQGAAVPKGSLLENGIAFVEPGKFYSLEVVYENPTDREIRFLVVAPEVDPQAALPFARARCWCASIPFEAPPGGAFLRTIQVGVAPNTPPGAKVIVTWPVVLLEEGE